MTISINPLHMDTSESGPQDWGVDRPPKPSTGGSSESPLVVHFRTVSRQGGHLPAFVNNLAIFLEDHIGIAVQKCSLPIPEKNGGIYCFFLDSDDAAEVKNWLGGVNAVLPARRVLAVTTEVAFKGPHKDKLQSFMFVPVEIPFPEGNKAAREILMLVYTSSGEGGGSGICMYPRTYNLTLFSHPLTPPRSAIASKVGSALVADVTAVAKNPPSPRQQVKGGYRSIQS